ncbi:tyrosine-type recombinase/integrase [candidate division WOR-3 bacterium]|nr:tyrosine-type recombinase/integrase [candidate division WOR-3 bacterium]
MVKDGKKPDKPLPKYLKEQEIKQLLNEPYKTKQDHILLMKFGSNCGLRSEEILEIAVKDISFVSHELVTIRVIGKGSIERIVPVPLAFSNEVQDYIKKNSLGYEDKLFDMKERGFRAMVKRYGKRAGLEQDVHPHMLRHTFAVHCLKQGMNLRTLQKLLGHKYLTTTQIYLDVTGQDVADDFYAHPLPY